MDVSPSRCLFPPLGVFQNDPSERFHGWKPVFPRPRRGRTRLLEWSSTAAFYKGLFSPAPRQPFKHQYRVSAIPLRVGSVDGSASPHGGPLAEMEDGRECADIDFFIQRACWCIDCRTDQLETFWSPRFGGAERQWAEFYRNKSQSQGTHSFSFYRNTAFPFFSGEKVLLLLFSVGEKSPESVRENNYWLALQATMYNLCCFSCLVKCPSTLWREETERALCGVGGVGGGGSSLSSHWKPSDAWAFVIII